MNITELVEELLDLKKSLGDIKVTKPYDLCGTTHHKEITYVLVGVDSKDNKILELL